MDKALAFSILSASPADIAAGADLGGRWTRLLWRSGAEEERPQQQREQPDRERPGSPRPHGHAGGSKEPAFLPRFAPEFDGIDCFETIVSH